VRVIQEGRKGAGLEITDRIQLWWSTSDDDLRSAWEHHGDEIADEVLAVSVTHDAPPEGTHHIDTDLPVQLSLSRS
jgi:isoleucyl-tRNA synthetase